MKLLLLNLKAKYYRLKMYIYIKKYGTAHVKTKGTIREYVKSEFEISTLKLTKEEK